MAKWHFSLERRTVFPNLERNPLSHYIGQSFNILDFSQELYVLPWSLQPTPWCCSGSDTPHIYNPNRPTVSTEGYTRGPGGQSVGTPVHCYLCVYEYQKEKESCFMLRLAMRVDVVMTLCVAKTFYIWDCNYAITTRQSITILLLKL